MEAILMILPLPTSIVKIVLFYAREFQGELVMKEEIGLSALAHAGDYMVGAGCGHLYKWINKHHVWTRHAWTRSDFASDSIVASLTILQSGELVSGSYDGQICVWDREMNIAKTLHAGPDLQFIIQSPDGCILSVTSTAVVKWDLETGHFLVMMAGYNGFDGASAMVVLPNGISITASNSGHLKSWGVDYSNGVEFQQSHKQRVTKLLLDGDKLVSASLDGTIKLWNPTTTECLHTQQFQWGINELAVLPDGRFITGFTNLKVQTWEAGTFNCLQTLCDGSAVYMPCSTKFAVSSNGDFAMYDGAVSVWK